MANSYAQDTKSNIMEKATVVELVVWKAAEGVSEQEAQEAIKGLNAFVSEQPGFVSRKTGISEDGQFVDVVLWTDLQSAQTASEKGMKLEEMQKVMRTIDETSMLFKHFEIFNELN